MMTAGKLIPMDRPRRLVKRVREYTANSELFFSDSFNAVTLFLDALPHADGKLLFKMIPLLGCSGDDRVMWPLFHLICSRALEDPVRTSTAIHLGLAASLSQHPLAIINALIEKLDHPDAAIRSSCALSLGWEGNESAIRPLMAHLFDPDQDVRAAVVAALSSVENESVLSLLERRLEQGSQEERRVIFMHLWRFRSHIKEVENIYIRHMAQADTESRLDILVGVGMLPLSPKLIDLYRCFVADGNARIRHQVLDNLSTVSPFEYSDLNPHLRRLLKDDDARVRQAAVKLFAGVN